ncbi:hypothetical protein [[Phormidium] sp. ETS-05]|uniref:hypothetical protein n=1 Tax=[Phormidium] sp. ETS-05 TaxID=222819 RepID=UPI0018EED9F9|nr:hypothetical protein [[Phormidium] sp. ETS-05]
MCDIPIPSWRLKNFGNGCALGVKIVLGNNAPPEARNMVGWAKAQMMVSREGVRLWILPTLLVSN